MQESSTYSLDTASIIGCGCAACQAGQPDLISENTEYTYNSAYAPTQAATAQQFSNYLINGYWQDAGGSARSWSDTAISFNLSNNFTSAQKTGLRLAFNLWSDVADITFSEVTGNADVNVVVGYDNSAWSSSSVSGGTIYDSTISITTSVYGWQNFNTLGDYALMTAIHEIGHTLGLGHTGSYNGSATYANNAQWTNDSHQYSVMSYFNDQNVGSDHFASSGGWKYSATPMLFDIYAIQQVYGANTSTRNSNTTYGFNSNAGKAIYDFNQSEAPFAIWDGGGTDTLDASGYNTNQFITLVAGQFSNTGHMTNNIAIAYGVIIENAIGGSGNDEIIGNAANNILTGNAGDDIFYGSTGNDTLYGDSGNDSVQYSYSLSEFSFNFISNTVVALTHLAQNFTDTLYDIENFVLSNGNYSFAQLLEAATPEPINLRFIRSDGTYSYNSTTNESKTFTATDLNYTGGSGNQFSLVRSANNLSLTVLDSATTMSLRFYGSASADTITLSGTHTTLTSTIYGGDGNDLITIASTLTGGQQLRGEGGNDTIQSGGGNDRVYGGIGDDILSGGSGSDKIYGDEGNDTLNGEDGSDLLYGLIGNDTINGGTGNDTLDGSDGDDILNGDAGTDSLFGGNGVDTISGGADNDTIYGGYGNDIINGDAGQDTIYGGVGDDAIHGGTESDYLYGQSGNDSIYGNDGNDKLTGGLGIDILYGGNGADKIYGEDDNDTLYGGTGNDFLYGGSGNDILRGEEGANSLYGQDGDDILITALGTDILYGGNGHDIFGLSNTSPSIAQVRDFTLSGVNSDTLYLGDILDFDSATDDANLFVLLKVKGTDRTDIFVNTDGIGDDWTQLAVVRGADFTGISLQNLIDNNQINLVDTLS